MEQERKNIVEVALTDEELDQLLACQRDEGFDTIQDGIINIIQFAMAYNYQNCESEVNTHDMVCTA